MSKQQTELTQVISEGGISGRHPTVDLPTVHVGPTTDAEFNTVRAGLVAVACWRVDDIRFEFDSSFVTPGIETELEHLMQLVKDHPPTSKTDGKPGFPLSVFGHADPVGNDDYNKQLSGRRATAIYALLTRDTNLWEKLFSQPFGNDKWGRKFLETMLDKVSPAPAGESNQEEAIQHEHNVGKRKDLFERYMENLCGPDLKLKKEDFLGHGDDAGGKGDFQGCSEFNPVLIFSQKDQTNFEQDKDKTRRNTENASNRRVMVLIFCKRGRVNPAKWPCPRASEGVAGCKKRFWSDGEKRRSNRIADESRRFEQSKDTFACRFYDRLTNISPCEWSQLRMIHLRIIDAVGKPRALMSYKLVVGGKEINDLTDNDGFIKKVISCSSDQAMLTFDNVKILLRLTTLAQIDSVLGVQQRLANLGILREEANSDVYTSKQEEANSNINSATRKAIMEFQARNEMATTGELDEQTRARLVQVHGS